jgi:hypothetical protein
VHNASASSIKWVVKIIDDYFFFEEISKITFHMNLLASGSIPVEGSSKNTILGFPSVEIAADNFLLFPPERFFEIISLNFIRSNCFNYS